MGSAGHAPGQAVVAATITTTSLAALITAVRLYTRILIVKKPGFDDASISAATVFSIALTVTMCEQVKYGMGRHYYTLTAEEKTMSVKWFWASVWIYYIALCLTKVSILLQYLRVFPQRGFRILCYVLMGVVVTYSLGTTLGAMILCVPLAHFWDRSIAGTCLNTKALWFSNTSLNIVTDICTAILPLPILRSLELPKRQKLALQAVFALGGLTCVVSILRLQSLYVVSQSTDYTWNNPLAAIWSSAELNFGIVCSCLPTVKGAITRYFPHLFSSLGSSARRTTVQLAPQPDAASQARRASHKYEDLYGPGVANAAWGNEVQVTGAAYELDGSNSSETSWNISRPLEVQKSEAVSVETEVRQAESLHGEGDTIPLNARSVSEGV